MTKHIRIFIAILAIVSLTVLAKNNVAWAANSTGGANPSEPSLVQDPVQRRDDDGCKKRDRHGKCQDKDKDKDKDKHKCKRRHDDDCGSVKPPPHHLVIPITGSYSVGGFCTLTVEIRKPNITLDAIIQDPLPSRLPKNLYEMQQGCLLRYLDSDHNGLLVTSLMSPSSVLTTICFASVPQKQVQIYFYNVYAAKPSWTPVETTVADGTACAAASQSGVYVPTFDTKIKKPIN